MYRDMSLTAGQSWDGWDSDVWLSCAFFAVNMIIDSTDWPRCLAAAAV